MRLDTLLSESLIVAGMKARTKDEAFRELVERLNTVQPQSDPEAIIRAVAAREALGGTAAGPGVAFPHARSEAVDDLHIVIGTAPAGIDFGAATGPVRFLALVLMTKTGSNVYLQSIAALARLALDQAALDKLVAAPEPARVLALIRQAALEVVPVLTAGDIMQAKFPRLGPAGTLKEAADLLLDAPGDTLVVLDESDRLVGLVGASQLIHYGLPEALKMMDSAGFLRHYEPFERLLADEDRVAVSEVLVPAPVVARVHTPIIQVALNLVQAQASLVPVLEGEKVVGVIRGRDFLSRVLRG